MQDDQQGGAITASRVCARPSLPSLLRIAVVAACMALGACTTVGMHTRQRVAIDYGPPMQMRVCVLKAPRVTTQRVDELIATVNTEFATYGIQIIVPWMRPWVRPGFRHQSLLGDVARRRLESPCDRLMAFGDRNVGDFLWGLAMPEVLGAVDDATHTRGYVVATRASLNQLIASPAEATVHEFYHLLGCPHAGTMSECYGRIAALKRSYDRRTGFFPGIGREGRFLLARADVNFRMQGVIAVQTPPEILTEEALPAPLNP